IAAGAAIAMASTCGLVIASSNRSDTLTPGATCAAVERPASAGSQTISRCPRTLKLRTRFLPQCPQPSTAILGAFIPQRPVAIHSSNAFRLQHTCSGRHLGKCGDHTILIRFAEKGMHRKTQYLA